jgi:hypothetical protein
MKNFNVKDLLVSIQSGVTADQEKKASELHVQGDSFPALHNGRRLELSVKCTQPSKAILQVYNATKEGPTKRKLYGGYTDPCPCPSKAPEEAFAGRKTAGQFPCSFTNTDTSQKLAELKLMLASMQATAEPVS